MWTVDVNEIAIYVIYYVCFLFALSFHEAAHGAIAYRCGDPSAKMLGRVTLNPLAHIDPIGTVLLPILLAVSRSGFVFGWAKPVPYNPRNLRNQRRDPVLIALAGPVSNLLIAAFFVGVSRILVTLIDAGILPAQPELVYLFLISMITINMVLAFFNIIPVPPLDGHHVLMYFLPISGQRALERIGPFGILIAVIAARPLFRLLAPLFDAVQSFALPL